MTTKERAIALLELIDAGVRQLSSDGHAPTLPDTKTIRGNIDAGQRDDAIRLSIYDTYCKTRNALMGAQPKLGTAFGLGRMLADTVACPRVDNWTTFTAEFEPHRLQNAYDWLSELSQELPARSAAIVTLSLQWWATWVAYPHFSKSHRLRTHSRTGTLKTDSGTTRALRQQGAAWRRVLSGEQDAMSLLRPDDYVMAGSRLLSKLRQIAGHFIRRWFWGILAVIVAAAASIWAAVTYAPQGSAKLAAVLASAAGVFGISWKGVGSTLGSAVRAAQGPLWATEIDTAVALAVTRLPAGARAPTLE